MIHHPFDELPRIRIPAGWIGAVAFAAGFWTAAVILL